MVKRWGVFVICVVLGLAIASNVVASNELQDVPGTDLRSWVEYLWGGGAGVAAFLFIEYALPKIAPKTGDIPKHWKKGISWVIAAALGAGAVGVGTAMKYLDVPIDARAWVEVVFEAAVTSILAAEAMHAGVVLRAKNKPIA